MSADPVVHTADIPELQVAEGEIAFTRRRLGAAAGTRGIGAGRFVVAPGARQMPVHVHGEEEEIFFVLAGEGIGYERMAAPYPVAAGDVIVHPPNGAAHSFLAGPAGLELLAFGSGSPSALTFLPHAGVMFAGPRWVPLDSPHPFRAEGLAPPLEIGQIDPAAPRPDRVRALRDVAVERTPGVGVRRLGAAAGSHKAGLNHVVLDGGARSGPRHCHTLEEELFVVLEGGGTLELDHAEYPLTAGDVVARPPSSGVAHALRAGEAGLTYLVYGTRQPGDIVGYPEAGKLWVRGVDLWLDAAAPMGAA